METVEELNYILTGNVVGGSHGHLHTFGYIQWECELFDTISYTSEPVSVNCCLDHKSMSLWSSSAHLSQAA